MLLNCFNVKLSFTSQAGSPTIAARWNTISNFLLTKFLIFESRISNL